MEMDASTDDASGSSSDDGRGQSEGSAEELLAAVIEARSLFLMRRHRRNAAQRARRRLFFGSVAGRRANWPRAFDQGMRGIMRDYFGVDGQPPVYGERKSERRFRVPRSVSMRIHEAIRDRPCWRQSINATGRPQAHALQKLVAVFRVLAYGESFDRENEYVRLSKSTIEVATKKLIEFIVEEWEPVYLRPPNDEEVEPMMDRNAARGMPGCIGSLDCSHWEWAACPKGLAGQYQNRKKRRTIVMETVCYEDLYIWYIFIGAPGSLNDLNVLRISPLYFDVVEGLWPPRSFSFCVSGRTRLLLYYLTDGVYPKYPFFVSPYPNPITPTEESLNRLQEALRKDVERLDGVLTARFHILLHPDRFGSVEQMILAGKAAAILHNMVVEHGRGGFASHEIMAAAAAARDGEPAAAAGDGHSGGAGHVGGDGDAGSGEAAAGDDEVTAAAGGGSPAGVGGGGGADGAGATAAAAGLGAAAAAAGGGLPAGVGGGGGADGGAGAAGAAAGLAGSAAAAGGGWPAGVGGGRGADGGAGAAGEAAGLAGSAAAAGGGSPAGVSGGGGADGGAGAADAAAGPAGSAVAAGGGSPTGVGGGGGADGGAGAAAAAAGPVGLAAAAGGGSPAGLGGGGGAGGLGAAAAAAGFGAAPAAAGGGSPTGVGGGGGADGGAGAAAAAAGLVGPPAAAGGGSTAAGPAADAAAAAAAAPRLAPMPHAPVGLGGADPPPGSFLFQLRTRQISTDRAEFFSLRDDLAAHIFADLGSFLEPHL